jgi:hypothetical protein
MTTLKFSDGEMFDTSGELRIERRADGLYVIGEGMLCACDTREECEALIRDLRARLGQDGSAK